ncbi:hypothetical protein [Rugamonas aquatica]|uniref:Uncharacterized protein n=1 Tax=Rugamonas aquatica TaxID=2743357 RepID=A0A6A7N6I9_9BURK|nr:hypothetical protein [Rugamonas aquatica]MQA40745.1 hypothetical protein [Rugamonas aquatica]
MKSAVLPSPNPAEELTLQVNDVTNKLDRQPVGLTDHSRPALALRISTSVAEQPRSRHSAAVTYTESSASPIHSHQIRLQEAAPLTLHTLTQETLPQPGHAPNSASPQQERVAPLPFGQRFPVLSAVMYGTFGILLFPFRLLATLSNGIWFLLFDLPLAKIGHAIDDRARARKLASHRSPAHPEPMEHCTRYPYWKGSDRTVMFVNHQKQDQFIIDGVRVHQVYREVPDANVYDLLNIEDGQQPLLALTLASRLELTGHGNIDHFEGSSAEELAQRLYDCGLRAVGVLKINACNAGKDIYLEDLRNELVLKGVQIGYVSGPRGSQSDIRQVGNVGKRRFVYGPLLFMPKIVGRVPEYFALRVVRGNANIAFPGTRYVPAQK